MSSVRTKICSSTVVATAVVTTLLKSSRWFQVDPWPNFEFEITVHSDAAALLERLVEEEERKAK